MKIKIFEEMLGKIMSSVKNNDDEELVFTDTEGKKYIFYHEQDCGCEEVHIEDICGDLSDLERTPLLQAEEVAQICKEEEACDSQTWTFYKFATTKGAVVVRWHGESNGYYSERVDFRTE